MRYNARGDTFWVEVVQYDPYEDEPDVLIAEDLNRAAVRGLLKDFPTSPEITKALLNQTKINVSSNNRQPKADTGLVHTTYVSSILRNVTLLTKAPISEALKAELQAFCMYGKVQHTPTMSDALKVSGLEVKCVVDFRTKDLAIRFDVTDPTVVDDLLRARGLDRGMYGAIPLCDPDYIMSTPGFVTAEEREHFLTLAEDDARAWSIRGFPAMLKAPLKEEVTVETKYGSMSISTNANVEAFIQYWK